SVTDHNATTAQSASFTVREQHLIAVSAGDRGQEATVQVLDASGAPSGAVPPVVLTFAPFPGYRGQVALAGGDLNGDGIPDVAVGVGPGAQATNTPAHVKVFDGVTGALLASFYSFDPASYRGGVSLGVGDVNGDGHADLVVGQGEPGQA